MSRHTLTNFTSQQIKRNPYSFFASLRETEPLYHFILPNGRQAWMVTSYDDAITLLKDHRFCKDIRNVFPSDVVQEALPEPFRSIERHVLFSDPPAHTRLRTLVSQAFTPRIIEQLQFRVQQIANELLDKVQDDGQMDLMDAFAFPLPFRVIAELLGMPQEDQVRFRSWMNDILNMSSDILVTEAIFPPGLSAVVEYLQALIIHKRKHLGSDLISSLIQAEESGDKLSENELIAMAYFLIVAGYETTAGLIGSGTLALLLNPDQMRLLQHNPDLIEQAVEELLRYTSPVALATQRWCREECIIHDKKLHKGDLIFISIIAANTDPQYFCHPEQLDILRQEQKHLAFGKGIHYCLGASLARLEGKIAFNTLLQRFPNLSLAVEPEELVWRPHNLLRGLISLPVLF